MRICFLSHYYPPEGNAPASRVHAMCRRWAAAGHDVTVLTCAPNVPHGVVYDGYENRWVSRETIDGVDVVRGWTYLAANQGFVRRILNYLSYLLMVLWRAPRLARPDVVVATTPQFFCGWAGVWAARIWDCPLVLEVRDLWPESIEAVSERPWRSRGVGWRMILRYLEWLEARMYAAAEHIVTVGEGYRRRLLDKGVPAAKLSVVTNGVDGELFRPRAPDVALRAEAGAGDGDFLVGYIGTVGMAHGLEVVIEAGRLARARGLDRLRFVVVGDGAERQRLVAELERDDPGNVRFVGRRPKAEMPAWLASVDACLVHLRETLLFETVLPSKMFEALAMARPVILGVRGEAAALLERLGGGVCVGPEDAGAVLDVTVAWASEPTNLRERGRVGRQAAVREFSLTSLATRYVELLDWVVSLATPARQHESARVVGIRRPISRRPEGLGEVVQGRDAA